MPSYTRCSLSIAAVAIAAACIWLVARSPAPASTADAGATGFVEVVGQLGGTWDAAVVDGDHLIQSTGARVTVFDIADARQPRPVGSTFLGLAMRLEELAAGGGTVFGAGSLGLWVIDARDPRQMQARLVYRVQSRNGSAGYANTVAVAGGLAFVGTDAVDRPQRNWERSTLDILDVQDPDAPRRIGQVVIYDGEALDEDAIPRALAVNGDRVALITHRPDESPSGQEFNTLHMIDVSDPTQPRIRQSIDLEDWVEEDDNMDVVLLDAFVIVTEGDALRVADITDPDQLRWVARVPLDADPRHLLQVADRLYVVQGDESIRVFDIGDPSTPRPLGALRLPVNIRAITAGSVEIFAEDYDNNLHTLRGTAEGGLEIVKTLYLPGYQGGVSSFTRDVAVAGDRAYLADGEKGLVSVDVSDPALPQPLGRIDTPGSANAVKVAGRYAYLADSSGGLRIIDVADATSLVEVGTLAITNTSSIAVQGIFAFVASREGIRVVDVADPRAPREVGRIAPCLGGFAREMALWRGHLYFTTERYYAFGQSYRTASAWCAVDVTDPTRPRQTAAQALPQPYAIGLAVADGRLYVTNHSDSPGEDGLDIYDLSDPAQPRSIIGMQMPGRVSGAIAVADNLAFIGDIDDLAVIDVADPTHPRLANPGLAAGWAGHGVLGRWGPVARTWPPRLTVAGGTLYIDGGGIGGLTIARFNAAPEAIPTLTAAALPTLAVRGLGTYTPMPTATVSPTATATPAPTSAPRPIYLPVVRRDPRPMLQADVVLLVDTSSSMSPSRLSATRAAVTGFFDLMNFERDQAAIVAFNRSASVALRMTRDRGALERALAGLAVGQGTRLDLAIRAARDELLDINRPGGPRRNWENRGVVILLTDGAHEGPATDVISEAFFTGNSGFRIYTIGLGPDADLGLLGRISDPGSSVAAATEGDLAAAFRAIGARLMQARDGSP